MECRIEFRSSFETAKEAGLVSKKENVNLDTDWDSQEFELFFAFSSRKFFRNTPSCY